MKHCTICRSDASSLKVLPQHGQHKHAEHERACDECWEAWISLQVEENSPSEIRCMFTKCTSMLDAAQIGKLARKGTVYRHAQKLKTGIACINRCTRTLQPFTRSQDGRIFTCQNCGSQTCVDCDKPEHTREACSTYQERLSAIHGAAEQKTHKAFKSCPSCDGLFETEGCGFTKCKCGYRFCSGCMIPWVGEGSAYLGGKATHGEGCVYLTRDRPSKHSLKRRFEEPKDVQARIDQKDLDNEKKREAKKARVEVEVRPKASVRKRRKGESKTKVEVAVKRR